MKTIFLVISAPVVLALGAGIGAALEAGGGVIQHGALKDLQWVSLREFGGSEAIVYRSPDGSRVAAAFRESGEVKNFHYPFDELFYVTSGTLTIKVHGGETVTLHTGEVAYMHEGMIVDFGFSPDFSDVAYLVSNHYVKWR
jgi:uncharacterized cupin superfamily protein